MTNPQQYAPGYTAPGHTAPGHTAPGHTICGYAACNEHGREHSVCEPTRPRAGRPRRLPRLCAGVFAALWLAAFVPAAGMLLRYEWTAGAQGDAPGTLSLPALLKTAEFAVSPSPGNDAGAGLLIVAIHPRCTCTRATLEELERTVPSWKRPVRTLFLIDQPATGGPLYFDWHQSTILREAQALLHAEVIDDHEGQQAARLGALTSGEVLFYSAPGADGQRRVLFSGGITAGRGMAGENSGLSALVQAVDRSTHKSGQDVRHSPVYGCGLAALAALTPVQDAVRNGPSPLAAPEASEASPQEQAR